MAKRLRGCRGIGCERGDAPLRYAEVGHEAVIEYDEDVMWSLKEMDELR
jgi:hypothetical protein